MRHTNRESNELFYRKTSVMQLVGDGVATPRASTGEIRTAVKSALRSPTCCLLLGRVCVPSNITNPVLWLLNHVLTSTANFR
jgi:hypothetical protein